MSALREIERLAGRLVMVGVRGAGGDDAAFRADVAACRDAGVGGVVLFDVDLPEMSRLVGEGVDRDEARRRAARNILSPKQAAALVSTLKADLGARLLVAVDQEGGEVSRLSPARGFPAAPSARAFGGLSEAGRRAEAAALADVLSQTGIGLNFAPCVDVAVNERSPIIAQRGRAYSDDPGVVARCAGVVVEAHGRAGALCCLKHFPGHGSARTDTHEGFTDVTRSFDGARELAVYVELLSRFRPSVAASGAGGSGAWPFAVMTGHLFHGRIDPEHPASLSRAHTTEALRGRMGFDGVVVVDSLDMGAVTRRYAPEEALTLALNAGADVLLDCNNAPGAARACPAPFMVEAVARGVWDGAVAGGARRLRESVDRIERWSGAPALRVAAEEPGPRG